MAGSVERLGTSRVPEPPEPTITRPHPTQPVPIGTMNTGRYGMSNRDVAAHLPDELKAANPRGIWRLVDGRFGKDPL